VAARPLATLSDARICQLLRALSSTRAYHPELVDAVSSTLADRHGAALCAEDAGAAASDKETAQAGAAAAAAAGASARPLGARQCAQLLYELALQHRTALEDQASASGDTRAEWSGIKRDERDARAAAHLEAEEGAPASRLGALSALCSRAAELAPRMDCAALSSTAWALGTLRLRREDVLGALAARARQLEGQLAMQVRAW
jgi:hypothetical protein